MIPPVCVRTYLPCRAWHRQARTGRGLTPDRVRGRLPSSRLSTVCSREGPPAMLFRRQRLRCEFNCNIRVESLRKPVCVIVHTSVFVCAKFRPLTPHPAAHVVLRSTCRLSVSSVDTRPCERPCNCGDGRRRCGILLAVIQSFVTIRTRFSPASGKGVEGRIGTPVSASRSTHRGGSGHHEETVI